MMSVSYPRDDWDEQRAAALHAVDRGRRGSWVFGGLAFLALSVWAWWVDGGWAAIVPVSAAAGVVVLASRASIQELAQRRVGVGLRRALSSGGIFVTAEQTRRLLLLGACWTIGYDYLGADQSDPRRVELLVVPPHPETNRGAGAGTASGGWVGGGGDGGGWGDGGGGGGDGGGGC